MNRGKRRKAQGEEPSRIEEFDEAAPSAAKRAWARLIKQVYEVDPLVYARCGGPMRIIAFIEQPEIIAKVLTHPGMWAAAVGLRVAARESKAVLTRTGLDWPRLPASRGLQAGLGDDGGGVG